MFVLPIQSNIQSTRVHGHDVLGSDGSGMFEPFRNIFGSLEDLGRLGLFLPMAKLLSWDTTIENFYVEIGVISVISLQRSLHRLRPNALACKYANMSLDVLRMSS